MAENYPRVVLERLFGTSDSTGGRVRASRLQQDRSILDSITGRVKALQRRLGPDDNRKVNDYLASLRDVERRIQKAEEQSVRDAPPRSSFEANIRRPEGIPVGFESHVGQTRRECLPAAGWHSRRVRVTRGSSLRPAVAGLPMRPHPRDHVHVWPRTEWAAVPANRRSRAPSSTDPSSERSGEDGKVRQDPNLSRQAVRGLPGETAIDSGWR